MRPPLECFEAKPSRLLPHVQFCGWHATPSQLSQLPRLPHPSYCETSTSVSQPARVCCTTPQHGRSLAQSPVKTLSLPLDSVAAILLANVARACTRRRHAWVRHVFDPTSNSQSPTPFPVGKLQWASLRALPQPANMLLSFQVQPLTSLRSGRCSAIRGFGPRWKEEVGCQTTTADSL
ncbi:hypothetical protein LY76DRAFT_215500 [Colletotrichum caudatum]|nr:hypothetical protein LY76DRAFT_215500 [Colletotrichum caudatum]